MTFLLVSKPYHPSKGGLELRTVRARRGRRPGSVDFANDVCC
jgi:hypothetical protein